MSLKKPAEISAMLARQWARTDRRIALFNEDTVWPIRVPIASPTHRDITANFEVVRDFLTSWRKAAIGEVTWVEVAYRSLAEPLPVPQCLLLHDLASWAAATNDPTVRHEVQKLQSTFSQVDRGSREIFLRLRKTIEPMSVEQCIQANRAAYSLARDCAAGVPLRAVALDGIDTKFIERHRGLITELMDVRYGGAVKSVGLEAFLGCSPSQHQWLLVADLDGDLLPVEQMRVRDTELVRRPLPAERILVVENEQCLHQIPRLPRTIAILGAGLNLSWLSAAWLDDRIIGYWGDIDTWGLRMLAMVRDQQPAVSALLMDESVFGDYAGSFAVPEPVVASTVPPQALEPAEKQLYGILVGADRGRLEQERVPASRVAEALRAWCSLV